MLSKEELELMKLEWPQSVDDADVFKLDTFSIIVVFILTG